MSETFDPNAWPYPQGSRPQQGSRTAPRDDDYDDLSYEESELDDDDYDEDDEFEDDDDSGSARAETTATRPNRTSARRNDDYEEDDYEDDDEYDEYGDGFDRDFPTGGGGAGRKIIGILAAVVLLGALVVGGIVLFGGGDSSDQASNDTETTLAPNNANPGGQTAQPPTDVAEATARALSAWGAFSVTGDLNLVRPYFVPGTNQWASLEKEAAELSADPPGGEPRSYAMTEQTATQTANGDWIVKGVVVVTRTGEQTLRYPWEIRLTRQADDQPWQILTVRQY